MSEKVNIILNGNIVEGFRVETILELAKRHGVEIPTLCNDPRLEPFTSCFVCVVEVEGLRGKKCPAKACKSLLTYEVITDKCTGCTVCAKNCPVNATDGERKQVHFIRQEDCIKCGMCYTKCKFEAIKLS